MKILHVTPTYLPANRYGGPIYSVHFLCKALVQQGHEVHVFTTNVDGPDDSDVMLEIPLEMDGVKISYFPSKYFRRIYWSPKMLRNLRESVKSFDLVHVHSLFNWPPWIAARLARKLGVPYIISPRGMLMKDAIGGKNTWLKKLWLLFLEKRNFSD